MLVADAWPHTLCRYSSAVSRYFHVPSPARQTSEWLDAVWDISDRHAVDLIVPIYEEVFYLAQAKATRPDGPALFAPSFETLIGLHDKWLFIEKARELGLSAPATTRIATRDELVRVFGEREGSRTVYKPIYSRFAAQTVVRPQGIEALDGVEPTTKRPWIAQEYLPGRPYATFTIAHQGRIAAHATYATDFCHDFGPTVVYRRVEQPAVWQWVRTFIEAIKYTGQVGFDFIEDASGRIAAIECNPRLTGGMYLLKDDPRFASAYFDSQIAPIEAVRGRSYTFRFWLFWTLFRHTKSFPGVGEWCRHFFGALHERVCLVGSAAAADGSCAHRGRGRSRLSQRHRHPRNGDAGLRVERRSHRNERRDPRAVGGRTGCLSDGPFGELFRQVPIYLKTGACFSLRSFSRSCVPSSRREILHGRPSHLEPTSRSVI